MGGSSLNKCPRITVVPNRLSSGTWSANAGAASARNACASPGSDARRRSMSATQADGTARSPGKHAPRNVRMPAVFATASNSCVILLFPMPASPGMTSVAPWPSAARLSAAPGRVMTACGRRTTSWWSCVWPSPYTEWHHNAHVRRQPRLYVAPALIVVKELPRVARRPIAEGRNRRSLHLSQQAGTGSVHGPSSAVSDGSIRSDGVGVPAGCPGARPTS